MSDLRLLDVIAIVVYLIAVAAIGLFAARKNASSGDYFLGNKGFGGVTLALSMVGTSLSSVTFLALPAAAFALDWRLLVSNWMMPLAAVLAILIFVPFFRRAKVVTAFEFLETRFGKWARLYTACSFIILQWVRVGSILYLVSIPVALMSGVPIGWVIVFLGVCLMAYTVAGGFDAVVWTDVIQVIVLILGGLFAFGYLVLYMPGGYEAGIAQAYEADKFALGDWDLDFTRRTATTLMLLGFVGWVTSYATDQTVVQRVIAARSDRDARTAVWLAVLLSIPTWTFFYVIGTSVWAFYARTPDADIAGLEADMMFPHFILTQLPAGVSGIIIAAVLAAAMSSLDSSINSVSTTFINDVYRRHLVEGREDRHYLKAAKVVSLLSGVLMIVGGLLYMVVPKESMLDTTKIIASIFGGCKIGIFMLGFFTTRVSERAILWALIPAVALNVYLGLNAVGVVPDAYALPIHNYWINLFVNAVFAAFAFGLAVVGLRNTRPLDGLTIWTAKPRPTQATDA